MITGTTQTARKVNDDVCTPDNAHIETSVKVYIDANGVIKLLCMYVHSVELTNPAPVYRGTEKSRQSNARGHTAMVTDWRCV